MDTVGSCYGAIRDPAVEELKTWQNLVSLWDRVRDPRIVMHEAPSPFEIASPACEGWVLRRKKRGLFIEWKRQWAILKRSHLLLFDRQCSPRPSAWVLLRHAQVVVKSDGVDKQKDGKEVDKVLCIAFSKRVQQLLLAVSCAQDLHRWQAELQAAVTKANVDSKACRPLKCSPLLVKQAALNGIPDCFRGTVWFKLAAADRIATQNPSRFGQLVRMRCGHDDKIRTDLHRTMATIHFFRGEGSRGQEKLFNVIHAYAVHDQQVGYCQGMNYLVAVLLLHMDQEQAFWVLVQMMKQYKLREHFMPRSPRLAGELFKFGILLQRACPSLYCHFTEEGVEASMFLTAWLVTLFASSFPLEFSLRVWDAFLVLGFPYVLQVAAVLIRRFQDQLLRLAFQEILLCLRSFPSYLRDHPSFALEVLAEAHEVAWMMEGLDDKGEQFVRSMGLEQPASSDGGEQRRRHNMAAPARQTTEAGARRIDALDFDEGSSFAGRTALGPTRQAVQKARPSDIHVRAEGEAGIGGATDDDGAARAPRLSDAWPGLGFDDMDDNDDDDEGGAAAGVVAGSGGRETGVGANVGVEGGAHSPSSERLRDLDAEEINQERFDSQKVHTGRGGATLGRGQEGSEEEGAGAEQGEGDGAGAASSWKVWPFKW